jgi:acetamidase/formamidase
VSRLSKQHRVFALSRGAAPALRVPAGTSLELDTATRDMAALLTGRLGLTADEATMLMSAGGDLQVSQIVDPLRTARFALSRATIAGLGRDLV